MTAPRFPSCETRPGISGRVRRSATDGPWLVGAELGGRSIPGERDGDDPFGRRATTRPGLCWRPGGVRDNGARVRRGDGESLLRRRGSGVYVCVSW